MPTPAVYVDSPTITLARFGLFAAASVITEGGSGSPWELAGVEYQSTNCATAAPWRIQCGPGFTATLTKTAVDNQYAATFAPLVGPYEISINGGAFAPILTGGTFVVPVGAANTVVVRETTGTRRSITFTGVDSEAATDTVLTATSGTYAEQDPKTGTDKPSTIDTPFGVYAGTACGSLGTLGVDDESRARASLAAGEQRAVESIYESGSQGNVPLLADAAAALPAGAGAVSLLEAVAALEDYLGDNYGGVGVLHAPRAVNPYAAYRNLLRVDGAVLRTWLDTAWAFGAGYAGLAPGGAAPAAGTAWIYATGAVTVRRSAVYVPATGAATLNTATNQVLLVAERTYLVSADCVPVAGALVDLAAEV